MAGPSHSPRDVLNSRHRLLKISVDTHPQVSKPPAR